MKMTMWISLPLFLLIACSESVDTSLQDATPEETFELLLKECMDHSFDKVAGVSMSIKSPLLNEQWTGAAGFADQERDIPLKASYPYRIASVTKTFVATAILRLHEMDSLSIEDPISKHLDLSFIKLLEADGYEPNKILIKHCLNHTSGLADYAMGGNDNEYLKEIVKDPQKRWTRREQVELAMNWYDKLGEPGEQTTYSDTGYILLGAIIEKFYGGDLALGLRNLINFDRLGMRSTWLESLEQPTIDAPIQVHRYFGPYDFTNGDASVDLYGGGGLISTSADLAKFFYALFHGNVYDKPSTLDLMLSAPDNTNYLNSDKEIEYYNYGLWTIKSFGNDIYMHNGLWGVTMLYIPTYETSIAVNTTRGTSDRLIKKTLLVLEELKARQ